MTTAYFTANTPPVTSGLRPVKRALISVSDKTGLIPFAQSLIARNIELISTDGTAQILKNAGLPVTDVADLTRFPEMMGGRVKTLHPAIHGALLAIRDNPCHAQAMQTYGILEIDLLIVNLYPFEAQVNSGADKETLIEMIDIGGPAMIRSSAKNYIYTTTLTETEDYPLLLAELERHNGSTSLAFRQMLSARAFGRIAAYDAAISHWFSNISDEETPLWHASAGKRHFSIRYGENPHQKAGFYRTNEQGFGVASATLIQGKELSYNNILDTDAAFELVSEFDPADKAAIAIIKHANPCGVAIGSELTETYKKALSCDPVSAFGGIIALNRPLDTETAKEIIKIFTEVIIAPDATEEARAILATKQNLRLLLTGGMPNPNDGGLRVRSVSGGLLVQSRDNHLFHEQELRVVSRRQPTKTEMEDLKFAFCVAKHVKSNAIIYARSGMTLGIGAGQMSRLDSARLAAQKAHDYITSNKLSPENKSGYVAASDAFFPFSDGLLSAIDSGATAVIQPGGSLRDAEVIATADEHNIAMVMTGMRHFKH